MQRTSELARCYMMFRHQYVLYAKPLWDQHLEMGDFDKNVGGKQLYWDDASKNVGYVDYLMNRVNKYGKNTY